MSYNKTLLSIISFIIPFICSSQSLNPFIKLDKLEYLVYYNFTFQRDSTDIYSKITEPMVLLKGNTLSQFVSYNTLRTDSVTRNITDRKEYERFIVTPAERPPIPRVNYKILKNFPEGKTTFIGFIMPSFFQYKQDLNAFNWKIKDQHKTFMGYSLQMATTHYGNREWIAWFTPEIPFSEGPYKFTGLPGLIVSIRDSQNQFVFEMTSIIQAPKNGLIEIEENVRPTTISKEEYYNAEKAFYKDVFQSFNSQPTNRGDAQVVRESARRNYNPIELTP